MIKPKLKLCHACNTPQPLWLSNPPTCKRCSTGVKAKNSPYKQRSVSTPTNTAYEDKRAMNEFFQAQVERLPRCCENCNEPFGFIPNWKIKWRMAHILAKRDTAFPSVKLHPDNLMFLCDDCHGKWDNGDKSDRLKMPVYLIAMERVEKFYQLLTDHEQVLLTKYL